MGDGAATLRAPVTAHSFRLPAMRPGRKSQATSARDPALRTLRVPGDKSITHRALILAGLAAGTSRVAGALASLDTEATAAALGALGAAVSPLGRADVGVTGAGGLSAPAAPLNCGNSGTTARLLCGALAAHRFSSTLTGDASLRRRPMDRVIEPLAAMGASFACDSGTLPLTVHGAALDPLEWTLPVPSAQVKSAILLAAAVASVPVTIHEPFPTRDHTERLLRTLGYTITNASGAIRFTPDGRLRPFELTVPGDLSSAAFIIGAAAVGGIGAVRLAGVGLNPTRDGFLDVLSRMGADWRAEARTVFGAEPAGDIVVRPAALRATEIEPHEVPRLIDEVPLLAVVAARAEGTTAFRGVGELRWKESDRFALLLENLRAVGVAADSGDDDLYVTGGHAPPIGSVRTGGDHRIAMAFAVLGSVPGAQIALDDVQCVAVSYPGFSAALRGLARRRAS